METKELITKVNEGLATLKTELEGVKAQAAKGVEFEAKLDKITDQITKSAEQLQEMDAKNKAIEAMMSRIDLVGDQKKATPQRVTESKAALRAYLQKGNDGLTGTAFKAGSEGIEIRSMSTDNNPNGGYLVVPEIADFMVTRIFETSPLRQLARVYQTQSKSLQVPIDDDQIGASWVGEGGATNVTSTPTLGMLEITTQKIKAEPDVTTEMLEDPFINVESWLAEKISRDFSILENTGFVTGSGVLSPKGILAYSAWAAAGVYERNKLEQVNLGNASAVTADGLIALQAALKEGYQTNATWMTKRSSYGEVLKLKGADNYFFNTTLLRDGQMQLQLLGKPLVFANDMPAIAANALSFAYGDFSVGYTILDRVGLNILPNPYRTSGVVSYFATKRVGGAVTNYDAIKIGKIST